MTALRQRMIEDLALQGYAERTKEAYVHAVSALAKYYGRSPDRLSEEDVRAFFLYLMNERKLAQSLVCAVPRRHSADDV